MAKRLYYEEIENSEPEHTPSDVSDASAVTPERDRYAELIAAAKKTERVRYRVRREDNAFPAPLFLIMGIIMLCAIFIATGKSDKTIIVFSAIALIAVIAGIVIFIVSKVRSNTPYYCYYARDSRGVFCMSVIGDEATVFAYGKAYRIEGERFYILDGKGYGEWLDGEGTGLYTVINASRADFEETGDTLSVFSPHGGGHEISMRDGVIEKIRSSQPYKTDTVDAKTGEARIKYKEFSKTEPTDDFVWEIPDFVRAAFEANEQPFPDMSGL